MDMWMMLHALCPGMEHTEESDLGTETFWIASDLDQRFRTDTQQQPIDEFLILQGERCQTMRHRKNDVGIGDGKKLFTSSLDPAPPGAGLAFWAMPI